MKIRYEDYPLLSGAKVKATKYNNDKNTVEYREAIVSRNKQNGIRLYFTETALRLVEKNIDLINDAMQKASRALEYWHKSIPEGDYCLLFKNGVSSYIKIDHSMPGALPYSFIREEAIEVAEILGDVGLVSMACLGWYHKAELEVISLDTIKRKAKKENESYYNETGSDVKIITINHSTTIIQNQEFWVTAHAAIRWVGKGRTDFKIVIISPFKKKGYTRKAGIVKANEEGLLHQAKEILNQ